jgi:hypothetical protein
MAAHDNAQMRLKTNIDPTGHEIGDEIWHTTLREAIHAEAEKTAHHFPPTVIRRLGQQQLVDLIAEDMAVWLHTIGDTYTAIDGVIYTLAEATTGHATADYAPLMTVQPVAVEATFKPSSDCGLRTAIIRWSDGTTSEAVRWYPDELLISEGDLIGKTQQQIRSLHHRRDRDWLQS